MSLLKQLADHGFVPDPKHDKLVRHKDKRDKRYDLESLRKQGWFETYQKYQRLKVFDKCKRIIVFIGESGSKGRFVGIYDVGARAPAAEHALPRGCPYPEWAEDAFYYPLDKRTGFEDLEDSLVIAWGDAPRQWHQWFTDRRVVEF